MALPADLAQIGREGSDMIEEFWGPRQRPQPHRETEALLYHPSHHQNHPYVHRYTESPLITMRPPQAQTLPNGTVFYHSRHQYTYQPNPSADLAKIAREGFDMINELWGPRRRVHHYAESPLITIRPPQAQTRPNGAVIYHSRHQYTDQTSPRMEVSQGRDDAGWMVQGCVVAVDSSAAASLLKGKPTSEYGGF